MNLNAENVQHKPSVSPNPYTLNSTQHTLIGAWSGVSAQGTSGIGTCCGSMVGPGGLKIEVYCGFAGS